MPKKKSQQELPLSDEAKEALLHEVLVRLQRYSDESGRDPADIADALMAAPTAEVADEETDVLSLWLDRQSVNFRAPGLLIQLLDAASARLSTSRSRLIYSLLWDSGVPHLLRIISMSNDGLKGSLKAVYDQLEQHSRMTAYLRKSEKLVEETMRNIYSYATSAEPEGWLKAMHDFKMLIDDFEEIKDKYWRRRLYGEVLRNTQRTRTILSVLKDQEIDGAGWLEAVLERWQREATA